MRVETKELEVGKKYELSLTPSSTDKVQLGMLTIETDCELKKHKKKLAFFSIQRPDPNPKPQALPIPKVKDDEAAPKEANKAVSGEAVDATPVETGEKPSS